MKAIKEADVRDGFTRRITYHIPYSTRRIDRFEYTGQEQIAYCNYSKKGHLSEKDFERLESIRDLPEGKYICTECIAELSNQDIENPRLKTTSGKFDDLRLFVVDLDETG